MEKKINAMPYGFALISMNAFEESRKSNKIRTKKMLSYIDQNHFYFCELISKGAFIPIHHLINDRYSLFFSINNISSMIEDVWDIVISWKYFSLYIDEEDGLWAVEFAEINSWNPQQYKSVDYIEGVYYDLQDNPHTDYKAIRYSIPKGLYNVEILGIKKKNITENRRENYGFVFKLTSVEKLSKSLDPSEVNFHALFES